jgi:hypothetical protein
MYFNESLDAWTDAIHSLLSECYGTNKSLGRYSRSMHNAMISTVLDSVTKDDVLMSMKGVSDAEKYISICHAAWSQHYIIWKNTTSTRSSTIRDMMATTWVDHLDPNQRQLYVDTVRFIFARLTDRVLEHGMKDLHI